MAAFVEPLTSATVQKSEQEDTDDASDHTNGSDSTEKQSNTANPRSRARSRKAQGSVIQDRPVRSRRRRKPIIWWFDIAKARRKKSNMSVSGSGSETEEIVGQTQAETQFLELIKERIDQAQLRRFLGRFRALDDTDQRYVLSMYIDISGRVKFPNSSKQNPSKIDLAVGSFASQVFFDAAIKTITGRHYHAQIGSVRLETDGYNYAALCKTLNNMTHLSNKLRRYILSAHYALELSGGRPSAQALSTEVVRVVGNSHPLQDSPGAESEVVPIPPSVKSLVWEMLASAFVQYTQNDSDLPSDDEEQPSMPAASTSTAPAEAFPAVGGSHVAKMPSANAEGDLLTASTRSGAKTSSSSGSPNPSNAEGDLSGSDSGSLASPGPAKPSKLDVDIAFHCGFAYFTKFIGSVDAFGMITKISRLIPSIQFLVLDTLHLIYSGSCDTARVLDSTYMLMEVAVNMTPHLPSGRPSFDLGAANYGFVVLGMMTNHRDFNLIDRAWQRLIVRWATLACGSGASEIDQERVVTVVEEIFKVWEVKRKRGHDDDEVNDSAEASNKRSRRST